MEIQELLFWIVVGILIGAVMILVADKILVNLVPIKVNVYPGFGSSESSSQSCVDGTPYGSCSSNQPDYCDNGNLIKKCSKCGCYSGSCQADETCVTLAV